MNRDRCIFRWGAIPVHIRALTGESPCDHSVSIQARWESLRRRFFRSTGRRRTSSGAQAAAGTVTRTDSFARLRRSFAQVTDSFSKKSSGQDLVLLFSPARYAFTIWTLTRRVPLKDIVTRFVNRSDRQRRSKNQ